MTICVGDWMHLRCGDRVREKDGRHVGRIEAIQHGAYLTIKWIDHGWIERGVPLWDVVKVRRGE